MYGYQSTYCVLLKTDVFGIGPSSKNHPNKNLGHPWGRTYEPLFSASWKWRLLAGFIGIFWAHVLFQFWRLRKMWTFYSDCTIPCIFPNNPPPNAEPNDDVKWFVFWTILTIGELQHLNLLRGSCQIGSSKIVLSFLIWAWTQKNDIWTLSTTWPG